MESSTPDVFISYSQKDRHFVEELVDDLGSAQINVWVDWKSLVPNGDYPDEIQRAIYNSPVFVWVLSQESAHTKTVEQELRIAEETGRKIIVAVLGGLEKNEVPQEFLSIKVVESNFFRGDDEGEGLYAFTESVRNVLSGENQAGPTPLAEWFDQLDQVDQTIQESLQVETASKAPARKRSPRKAAGPEIPAGEASLDHNGVRLSVALTSKGWRLQADGLVLRDGRKDKSKSSAFYRDLLKSLDGSSRSELEDRLEKSRHENKGSIESSLPCISLSEELSKKMLPFSPRGSAKIILLPDVTPSADQGEETRQFIRSALETARREHLTSLVLPPLSLTPLASNEEIAAQCLQILNALLETREFGELRSVTIATDVSEALDTARRRFNIFGNNRAQALSNDQPSGQDLLGISAEVDALADTLLLREVRPPLAVGITGGWGSGKSFVMYMIRQRMSHVRTQKVTKGYADASGDKDLSPFVGHIYQIQFNAWTYAKSNLWASLMYTIFFELNRQISLEKVFEKKYPPLEGGSIYAKLYRDDYQVDDPELREHAQNILDENLLWQTMRGQKEAELQELHDLEVSIADWKAQREQRNKEQLEKIQKDLGDQAHYAASEILKQKVKALAGQFLDDKNRKLLDQEANLKVGEVEELLASLRSTTTDLAFVWNTIKNSWKNRVLALLLACLLVGGFLTNLPAIATLFHLDVVTRLVTQLGAMVVALLPIVQMVNGWSQRIKQIAEDYQSSVETEKRNWQSTFEARVDEKRAKDEEEVAEIIGSPTLSLDQKLSELQDLVNKANSTDRKNAGQNIVAYDKIVEILQAQAEDKRKKVGPTARYLTLLEFVRSRLDKAGYENQLGLMHQVCEDFNELTINLMRVNDHTKEMFKRGEPRIVLFIDDLDRCPPPRVVEVLEAVQLLLNTELFVVVLGLDTRYVTRALEKEYKEILQHEGDPSGMDYIEKIIQIPYRVRPMEPTGLQNYLKAQMEVAVATPSIPPSPPPQEKPKRGRRPKSEPAPPPASVPGPSPVPTTPAHAPVALPPEVIKFQAEDLEDLTLCCQQVDLTPRSVKRLVNVFKLIKIFWFREFGGDHQRPVKQAAMSLLALSAAYPEIMRESFVRLDMWLRNENFAQKAIFEELATINLDTDFEKIFALKLKFFKRDIEVFKSKDFGNIALSTLEINTFNLVRSFCFVGDPSFWADQEPEHFG